MTGYTISAATAQLIARVIADGDRYEFGLNLVHRPDGWAEYQPLEIEVWEFTQSANSGESDLQADISLIERLLYHAGAYPNAENQEAEDYLLSLLI